MLKADNTQKRCFVACDEQTKKDGRCSCLSNTHQSLQLLQTDVISSFFMDKELEIASQRYSDDWEKITRLSYEDLEVEEINKLDFINGANWQRNRLFTNEEVIDIIQKRLLSIGIFSSYTATEIWFNQYKK